MHLSPSRKKYLKTKFEFLVHLGCCLQQSEDSGDDIELQENRAMIENFILELYCDIEDILNRRKL